MPARKSKSAVIFDLDNTLVDTYGVYRNAKLKLAEEIKKLDGKITNKNKFVDELFKRDRELCKKFNTWDYDQRELILEACKMADCNNCNIETLVKEYEEELKKIPQLLGKAKETLITLKNRGVYLVLLSEGSEEQQEMTLKEYGLDKLFDDVRFVGRKKENHFKLIMKALQNMGYTHIYCVGDSLKKDIRPANSVGAQTIWVQSEWEAEQPKEPSDQPKHQVNKIEEVLSII